MKIGRTEDNQLIVNDGLVSGHHAQIMPQGSCYELVDLNSTNGTFLNGQRLTPYVAHPLNNGDTLRFGGTLFSFMDEAFLVPPTMRGMPPQSSPNDYRPQSQAATGHAPQFSPNGKQDKQQDARKSSRSMSNWVKIVGALASLATIFGVIWTVYTYVHPSFSPAAPTPTPVPTPSIPRLHSSYSGTMVRLDTNTLISITMSSLNEDNTNGNFTAEGTDAGANGGCTATYDGVIRSDNSISFTLTETQVQNCGLVVTFTGKLFPDGHLAGNWQGPTSVEKGSWTIS